MIPGLTIGVSVAVFKASVFPPVSLIVLPHPPAEVFLAFKVFWDGHM
jgi:hypothetical protein